MGVVKSLFSSPKLPKVDPQPPPPPEDTGTDAIAQAAVDARRAARRRAGMAALVYSGSAATGATGTPRTASGGLIGS